MKRQYCNRCNADVTNKKSAALYLIDDADENGGGTITGEWDLCPSCARTFRVFLNGAAIKAVRRG